MNITVTFRHVDASPAIKARAEEKLAKLQKFLRQPMTARVTVSLEKLLHQVEARVSSGGERYEAHEVTEDMYTSIDKVLEKLERQIRGSKGAAQSKKRRAKVTLKSARAVPALAAAEEEVTKRRSAGPKAGSGSTRPAAKGRKKKKG